MMPGLIYRFQIHTLSYVIIIFLVYHIKAALALPSGLYSRAIPDGQTPPKNALVVRKTDTGTGEFATLSSALSSLEGKSGPQFIFIHEGVYEESITIEYPDPITIQGYTTDPTSYNSNTVTISNARSALEAGSDAASSVLWIHKDDFAMFNINLVNAFGTGTDTQAIALTVHGKRQAYYSCRFESFQDTLYVNRGSAYFEKCRIEGAVDFIFGSALAWFEEGSIGIKRAAHIATITANKRSSQDDPSIFVFNKVSIMGMEGALRHSSYLGRPWSSYARVIFQFCTMSDVINPEGWMSWNPASDPRTDHVEFGEYANVGEGSGGQRVTYSKQLSSKYEIADVLGKDSVNWI